MIEVYVAGSYSPSSDVGGWGVVLVGEDKSPIKAKGAQKGSTQNSMVLKATVEGLLMTDENSQVKLISNSEYLVMGMKDARRRKANRDLWEQLDNLANKRSIDWQQVGSHKWLKEAQMLAQDALKGR